ncbi:hypothetical protein ACJRO7_034772 [Eucalyptus globulus]|uniref:DUF7798 domain-containing protein n=1 Tax=Eucalyptus globulus TaxID=34317 RepID=A0ABD3J9S0_EUCGL
MEDDEKSPVGEETKQRQEASAAAAAVEAAKAGGGGGWGGWGFSPLSVFSDLQKAAEEISRNAAEAAKNAAKSISDVQNVDESSDSSKEEEGADQSAVVEEKEDESDQRRKSALEKLENASEESLLGQKLKAFDSSVENLASGAWQALGNAWKGGTNLVNKLEHSAVNLAETVQQGGLPRSPGSVAPSLLETGKAFTAKGIQVLEYVGKETIDLLISETGIEVEKNSKETDKLTEDDQLFEEVSFDRCFYIYGGPEQLEELEALSSHYALLFNRRKAKLPSEQKALYDGKLKEVQQIFNFSEEVDGGNTEVDKGKKVETVPEMSDNEMKNLHDSSVSKAADMATGFTNAISGISTGEMIQRTASRLEALHSEGVHRLSEMCCFAVTQLLVLGKSVISSTNKDKNDDDMDVVNIEWPEDSLEKAKIIRIKAQSMTVYVEAISRSFITGISDVTEAYSAAIKGATADSHEVPHEASIQQKASAFSEHLRTNQTTAVGKIQDGLQYLAYVVISSSMPAP